MSETCIFSILTAHLNGNVKFTLNVSYRIYEFEQVSQKYAQTQRV